MADRDDDLRALARAQAEKVADKDGAGLEIEGAETFYARLLAYNQKVAGQETPYRAEGAENFCALMDTAGAIRYVDRITPYTGVVPESTVALYIMLMPSPEGVTAKTRAGRERLAQLPKDVTTAMLTQRTTFVGVKGRDTEGAKFGVGMSVRVIAADPTQVMGEMVLALGDRWTWQDDVFQKQAEWWRRNGVFEVKLCQLGQDRLFCALSENEPDDEKKSFGVTMAENPVAVFDAGLLKAGGAQRQPIWEHSWTSAELVREIDAYWQAQPLLAENEQDRLSSLIAMGTGRSNATLMQDGKTLNLEVHESGVEIEPVPHPSLSLVRMKIWSIYVGGGVTVHVERDGYGTLAGSVALLLAQAGAHPDTLADIGFKLSIVGTRIHDNGVKVVLRQHEEPHLQHQMLWCSVMRNEREIEKHACPADLRPVFDLLFERSAYWKPR